MDRHLFMCSKEPDFEAVLCGMIVVMMLTSSKSFLDGHDPNDTLQSPTRPRMSHASGQRWI